MKVLIVTSVLPVVGGVATWINLIARILNEKGYKNTIINMGGVSNRFTFFPDIIIRLIRFIINYDTVFFILYVFAKYKIKFRTEIELRKNKYDIIHAQDINACNALWKLCRKHNIKLILTVHGHFYKGGTATRKINEKSKLGKYLLSEEIMAYNQADHIITVSLYSYKFVSEIIGESKISLINNFVDTKIFFPYSKLEKAELRKKFNYNKDDFIIVYAGQLVSRKGVNYLIDGVLHLKDDICLKLIIVGEGIEKNNLVRLVKENKIEKIVNFTGRLSINEIVKMYNLSDVFVISSVSDEGTVEGTPMVILEAMACGLPVIASSVGGIPDVVKHMETGILIEEKDGAAVADAIKLLYENTPVYLKVQEKALLTINNSLSLNIVINKILDIYMN